MVTMSKRRWTYVATAIAAAIIVILAVILMQQPIPTSTLPQVKTPPSVSTAPATGIDQTVATLNGNLGTVGSAATVSVGFQYSTDPGLAGATNVSVGSLTAATPFNRALTGLNSGTKYYFQAWAAGDGFTKASTLSFTTLTQSSPQVHAPSVATKDASSIGQTSATLNGNLGSLGTASSVTVGFLYSPDPGLTGSLNVSLGAESAVGTFAQPVTGLAVNTTYYVKAWAVGDGFASGSVVAFQTAAAPTDLEGRAVVRQFLEDYLAYTPDSVDRNMAAALNMMTTNLKAYTLNQLRDKDTIGKIKDDHIISEFEIRSMDPVKGLPWTYTVFGVKGSSSRKTGNRADRSDRWALQRASGREPANGIETERGFGGPGRSAGKGWGKGNRPVGTGGSR